MARMKICRFSGSMGKMRKNDIYRRHTAKRGRPYAGVESDLIWKVERGDPKRNVTITTISMCIKEDMGQSLAELAERVAKCKNRPIPESLAVLRELHDSGKLGYYDDVTMNWKRWEPGRRKRKGK